ncbi:hypothetical protein EGW08_017760 [Elysia chlorotica]|uniref:Uncharacterized protein n=1 Tax=Elysia chlorotica TaxID=188477 RepID=A0A433SYV6_ELYCH|nr:hypothetical protein EGW08_017760 [Elysia chlorotica]
MHNFTKRFQVESLLNVVLKSLTHSGRHDELGLENYPLMSACFLVQWILVLRINFQIAGRRQTCANPWGLLICYKNAGIRGTPIVLRINFQIAGRSGHCHTVTFQEIATPPSVTGSFPPQSALRSPATWQRNPNDTQTLILYPLSIEEVEAANLIRSDQTKVLDVELAKDRLPKDVVVIQRFLYDSIEFVALFKDVGDKEAPALVRWMETVKSLMFRLSHDFPTWNLPGLKIGTVMVYLNHLTYHLVETKMTSLEHLKFMASAIFHLICTALRSGGDPDKPELVSDVALKTYSMVCAAGQRVQKSADPDSDIALRQCYECYLLATACLNLDNTNKTRDGLKTAMDFILSYIDWQVKHGSVKYDVHDHEDMDFTSQMVSVAVRIFTAQPREVHCDTSLSFFTELFRLAKWQPSLVNKLYVCSGNLFSLKIRHPLFSFSDNAFEAVRALNYEKSTISTFPAKDTVIWLLWLLEILVTAEIKDEASATRFDELLEEHAYFADLLLQLTTLLTETSKPLQPSLVNALNHVTKMIPVTETAKKLLEPRALRLFSCLSCLAVRVAVREVLRVAGKAGQESKLQGRVYQLAVVCKLRLVYVQQFFTRMHSDPKAICEMGTHIKPVLTALIHMVALVDKKNLVDPESSAYRQIYKCLECAVYSIGSLGRNLRRSEQYTTAVAFLSQLWPVANVSSLTSMVTYHESLLICYRLVDQPQRALQVVKEAAALDPALLTDIVIKNLVKIAEEKSDVNILIFFKSLENDELRHVDILDRVVKCLLACQLTAIVFKHCQDLLTHLHGHSYPSATQRAVYWFLLAELMWTYGNKNVLVLDNKPYCMAVEAMNDLSQDESDNFTDYFCQAAFLVWEIKNRGASLRSIAKLSEHWDTRPRSRANRVGEPEPTPTAVSNQSGPRDASVRQQGLLPPATADFLVDSDLGLGTGSGSGGKSCGLGGGGKDGPGCVGSSDTVDGVEPVPVPSQPLFHSDPRTPTSTRTAQTGQRTTDKERKKTLS